MGLRLKFNLVVFAVFLLGICVAGFISYDLLQKNARQEVMRDAGLMMESALAMRVFTADHITPHLSWKLQQEFLPESVPAFAASRMMGLIRQKYPDYVYKEPALNPTNPRNRAVDWEADIVHAFRNNPELKEFSGVRDTPAGPSMYFARPFKITDPACLVCHSVPQAAPASMVKLYGDQHGFGWQMNEVIGVQLVSVPMRVPIESANQAFLTFMGLLAVVFVVLFIIMNVMMSLLLVKPITSMSRAADKISVGDMSMSEFDEHGKDELARLARSFNRMRRSLEKAIQMIDRR